MIFIGVTLLGRSQREVELMRYGELLDQWEIYKQFNGMAKPRRILYAEDVIPSYLR